MSRFFAAGSSSESETSSSEESIEVRQPARFATGDSSSEDDVNVRRIVRSAKEKYFEELRSTCRAMKAAATANDWNTATEGLIQGHLVLRKSNICFRI